MGFPPRRDLFLAIATILLAATALPEAPSTVLPGPLDSAQIVARMTARDQARNVGLQHYQSLRHYKVQYHGYSTTVAASMSVEVNYDIGSGKSFRIVSESGSKFLLEKVLKRAVDSEKEAFKDRASTALTAGELQISSRGERDGLGPAGVRAGCGAAGAEQVSVSRKDLGRRG